MDTSLNPSLSHFSPDEEGFALIRPTVHFVSLFSVRYFPDPSERGFLFHAHAFCPDISEVYISVACSKRQKVDSIQSRFQFNCWEQYERKPIGGTLEFDCWKRFERKMITLTFKLNIKRKKWFSASSCFNTMLTDLLIWVQRWCGCILSICVMTIYTRYEYGEFKILVTFHSLTYLMPKDE